MCVSFSEKKDGSGQFAVQARVFPLPKERVHVRSTAGLSFCDTLYSQLFVFGHRLICALGVHVYSLGTCRANVL